jgi:hypothetical protein
VNLFARSDENSPRTAFRRVGPILRRSFKVQKFSENDWMFERRPQEACLLTLWGYREPYFEHPVREGAADGLVWDVAWCARRRGLSEGALALATGAAGRGSVDLKKGDFLNPSEIFFYDRMTSAVDFAEGDARSFLESCAGAVARIDRALRQG